MKQSRIPAVIVDLNQGASGWARRRAVEREQILVKVRERIVAFAASHYTRECAEDLAQEVMLVLHEKYSAVTRIEELVPLALQISRFKLNALRRKEWRRGEHSRVSVDEIPLPDPHENPGLYVERKETIERLKIALAGLGERCRELFRLKLSGKTFEEIRLHLGVKSINTIYTWDHRCRQQLLERMGGDWESRPRSPSAGERG